MKDKTFGVILFLGIALRTAGIWIPQLWYDENFTLILARLPFDRMIAATMGDVHPPLWYIIEWSWAHYFPEPWMLRIPALLFSIAALVVFRELMGEMNIPAKIQTGAMLLMAVMPMQLWYAQEARMYSLLEVEVLFALLVALRGQWLALFVVSTAMLYTQNYSVFYLACIWLVILLFDLWALRPCSMVSPRVFPTTLSMAVASTVFLPWVKVIATQMSTISGRYWIQQQSIGDVLNIIYKLFWSSAMPSFALVTGMIVTFMALCVGVLYLVRDITSHKMTIIIMAFGPIALAALASALWQPILLHRPLIGVSPFLYLIVAWSFGRMFEQEQIRDWREATIALALVVPVLVSGIGAYYKNIPAMKSDGAVSPLIDALAYVRSHWQPGDIIYYTDDGPMVNLSPYAEGLPQYEIPVCGNHTTVGPVLGSLSPATRAAIGILVADLSDIDYTRAWVFAPRSPLHPKCYEEQIAPLTVGAPLITVDDNPFIFSGVWMVTK